MKLVIEINCDNAAFSNDDGDGTAIGPECARILRNIAHSIKDLDSPDGDVIPAIDVNGNRVGSARFID